MAPPRRGERRYRIVGTAGFREARSLMRNVTLLGATGSIGDSTLDVIARHPDRFAVASLAAHRNWRKLAQLCRRFRPRYAALLDVSAAKAWEAALTADGLPTRVLAGPAGLAEVAALPDADTVLAAIVGAADLRRRSRPRGAASGSCSRTRKRWSSAANVSWTR